MLLGEAYVSWLLSGKPTVNLGTGCQHARNGGAGVTLREDRHRRIVDRGYGEPHRSDGGPTRFGEATRHELSTGGDIHDERGAVDRRID